MIKRLTLFFVLVAAVSSAATGIALTQRLEVTEATITELQAAMAAGTVTSVDLVDAYLARIAAYDKQGPRLNAIVLINPRAGEEAAALDQDTMYGALEDPDRARRYAAQAAAIESR